MTNRARRTVNRPSGPVLFHVSLAVLRFAIANRFAPRHLIKSVYRCSTSLALPASYLALARSAFLLRAPTRSGSRPFPLKNLLPNSPLGHFDLARYNGTTRRLLYVYRIPTWRNVLAHYVSPRMLQH